LWYRDGRTVIGTRTPIALLVGLGVLVSARPADAAEVTRVLGARSLQDFDIDVSLVYQHDQSNASIKREVVQSTGTLLVNDVLYHHSRDAMLLRGEVGLVHDLSFFLSGSLVLADQRGLDLDRSGNCAAGNCLETLLRDGFLPSTQASPSGQVFGGPYRRGFEYLGLGLRWAATNQDRDRTKPTWMVGLETRFSVASDQRFDPANPTANRGVGAGYHLIILSTLFSRRFGVYEPYMGGWLTQPVLTSNSVYGNLGSGAFSSAQRRIGGDFGLEDTVWENPALHARFALEAAGRLEYRLEGLAQSELWEVLSGDSGCPKDPAKCRAGIDVDSSRNAARNSGIVRSPGYGLIGGDAGFSAHVGRHARFRGLFGILFEESHFLTDAGSNNSVYDIPGRRFRVEGIYAWRVLLDATATF
jgi:hypothetical protein